ncbi:MAG TPA: pectinesterase family protein [Rhizomicrobium sp.]|jgi:pectinesterase|nr:pectinesterase family protein [Rhizomicrobium sp.]
MRLTRLLPLVLCIALHAQDVHVRVSPDVKTGIEGTTEFPTIQMALDHHPFAGPGGRVFIEIAPGTYHERLNITQNHTNIALIGTGHGPEDVVITNSLNAKQAGGTFFTETVEVDGAGFEADNVTFENSAGNTGQAVAIVVRADRAVFKHCRFLGYQDTLFADYGRQYYVDSYIEGVIDFIFGNAAAVFDHSEIHANGPGYLTAQSRTSPDQSTGYVIVNSRVTTRPPTELPTNGGPEGKRTGIFLGRPWRPYARVVFIRTDLPADIRTEGWNNWGKEANEKTAWFAEFANTGPGAATSSRANWVRRLSAKDARQFQPKVFLAGRDHWNPKAEAAKLP